MDKKYKKYNDSVEQLRTYKTDLAVDKLRFHHLDTEFRLKYAIPLMGFSNSDEGELWLETLAKNKKLQTSYKNDLESLAGKAEYPVEEEGSLEGYLLYNTFSYSNKTIAPFLCDNEITGVKEMRIRIYPETRLADLKGSWDSEVLPSQKRLSKFTRKNRAGFRTTLEIGTFVEGARLYITLYEKSGIHGLNKHWGDQVQVLQIKLPGYKSYKRKVTRYYIERAAYTLRKRGLKYSEIYYLLKRTYKKYKPFHKPGVNADIDDEIKSVGSLILNYKNKMKLQF